jgi:uncharacterized membrane protein YeaQ/YmgE (transglycosylase-associated protein family)
MAWVICDGNSINVKGVEMLATIITWIIIGALAGWLASILTGTNREVNGFTNIIVGIVGAFIGGLVVQLFGGNASGISGFNLGSLLTAVLGAVILLALMRAFRSSRV